LEIVLSPLWVRRLILRGRLYRQGVAEAQAVTPDIKPAIIFPMGYPQWTLLGMGLSIVGALIALAFALLGQSPGLIQRLGLGGARLDLRVRTFTTYAFALVLLSIGFFLAGIPVDSETDSTAGAGSGEMASLTGELGAATASPASSLDSSSDVVENATDDVGTGQEASSAEDSAPESGSFNGPPPVTPGLSSETGGETDADLVEGTTAPNEADIPPPGRTGTPRPTSSPTTAATPTPTETPSPTITPTPISGETAIVSSGGSTIWIVRSPGVQNLTLVRDGDTLLLQSGHANQAGQLWREVRTVNGILGWIQEIFLEYPE
jgi:hypothetical protein